jgi:hypothetical protein
MQIKNAKGEVTLSPKEQEKEQLAEQIRNNPKPTTVVQLREELDMIKKYLGLQ